MVSYRTLVRLGMAAVAGFALTSLGVALTETLTKPAQPAGRADFAIKRLIRPPEALRPSDYSQRWHASRYRPNYAVELHARQAWLRNDFDGLVRALVSGRVRDNALLADVIDELEEDRFSEALKVLEAVPWLSADERSAAARRLLSRRPLAELLEFLPEIENATGPGANALASELAARWAAEDDGGARRWARSLEPLSRRSLAMARALCEAANPGGTSWTEDLKSLGYARWGDAMEHFVSSSDPGATIEWLTKNGIEHPQWPDWCLESLRRIDDAGEAWTVANELGWLEGSPSLTEELAARLAGQDPDAYARTLLSEADAASARLMARGGLEDYAAIAPSEAVTLTSERPDLLTGETLRALLRGLSDPTPALPLLRTLAGGDDLRKVSREAYLFATRLADRDAPAAAQFVTEALSGIDPPVTDSGDRVRALRTIVGRLREGGTPDVDVGQWAARLPPWERDLALDALAAQLTATSPEEATYWALRIEDDLRRRSTLTAIANFTPGWRTMFERAGVEAAEFGNIEFGRDRLDLDMLRNEEFYY